jgi:hypothetical protein
LNLTQRRYAARLQELIDESKNIETLVKKPDAPKNRSVVGLNLPYIEDKASLNAWLIKVKNIIEIIFGRTSTQFGTLEELTKHNNFFGKSQINAIKGVLIGSLDDLENGFLLGQEFLIAGEIFDSVLEEAKHILNAGYKDPAAVLGRVVLEDALKRLARQEQLNDTQKASVINDELKKAGKYNQPQWRQIQAWLDIGNSAAHGKFYEYNEEQVREQIEGVERFLANEFRV